MKAKRHKHHIPIHFGSLCSGVRGKRDVYTASIPRPSEDVVHEKHILFLVYMRP